MSPDMMHDTGTDPEQAHKACKHRNTNPQKCLRGIFSKWIEVETGGGISEKNVSVPNQISVETSNQKQNEHAAVVKPNGTAARIDGVLGEVNHSRAEHDAKKRTHLIGKEDIGDRPFSYVPARVNGGCTNLTRRKSTFEVRFW